MQSNASTTKFNRRITTEEMISQWNHINLSDLMTGSNEQVSLIFANN